MKRMRRLALIGSVAAVALGIGATAVAVGRAGAEARSRVSVRVVVTSGELGARRTRSFTLTCNPSGGSMPFSGRLCQDVRLHPKAMLDPPKAGQPRTTMVCGGGPSMPEVSVSATRSGVTRTFSGSPGCAWPGNQAIAVYYDAATRDTQSLPKSEAELRCDEDPILFRIPTPIASVVACRHGLWTPHAERLIRIAETSAPLAAFQPAKLFPHDVGALACTIHAGGAYPGRNLPGLCGVTIRNLWSKPTVSFTENWATGTGKNARHLWQVVLQNDRVVANRESGPAPPQTWP